MTKENSGSEDSTEESTEERLSDEENTEQNKQGVQEERNPTRYDYMTGLPREEHPVDEIMDNSTPGPKKAKVASYASVSNSNSVPSSSNIIVKRPSHDLVQVRSKNGPGGSTRTQFKEPEPVASPSHALVRSKNDFGLSTKTQNALGLKKHSNLISKRRRLKFNDIPKQDLNALNQKEKVKTKNEIEFNARMNFFFNSIKDLLNKTQKRILRRIMNGYLQKEVKVFKDVDILLHDINLVIVIHQFLHEQIISDKIKACLEITEALHGDILYEQNITEDTVPNVFAGQNFIETVFKNGTLQQAADGAKFEIIDTDEEEFNEKLEEASSSSVNTSFAESSSSDNSFIEKKRSGGPKLTEEDINNIIVVEKELNPRKEQNRDKVRIDAQNQFTSDSKRYALQLNVALNSEPKSTKELSIFILCQF